LETSQKKDKLLSNPWIEKNLSLKWYLGMKKMFGFTN
jgi:hypothetical protein